MFTRRVDIAVIVSLLLALSLMLRCSIALASDYQLWAKEYYRENTACTVASISALHRSPNKVIVELEVEDSTADALANSLGEDRDNWMALHCPSTAHSVWAQSADGFDIEIIAMLGKLGRYTLSCSQFHRIEQFRIERNKQGIWKKLKTLLDN